MLVGWKQKISLLFSSFLSGLLLCSLLSFSGCAPPTKEKCADAENNILPTTVELNKRPCQENCECNNQNYVGACRSGRCESKLRESCEVEGKTQDCELDETEGCKKGWQTCQGEGLTTLKWGNCKPVVQESETTVERCGDGVDNDCDGKIDKSDPDCKEFCNPGTKRPCYNGPPGTESNGVCTKGEEKCTDDGVWSGKCEGERTPTQEECNKKDDDCDGQVDEGLNNCNGQSDCDTAGQQRECYPPESGEPGCQKQSDGTFQCKGACKAGKQTCEQNTWGPCIRFVQKSEKELCDQLDNNCNGQVDEDFKDLGKECEAGAGECLRKGTIVCKPDKSGAICNATPGQPKPEACNGKDDNCNGAVDELCPCIFNGKDAGVCKLAKNDIQGNCQRPSAYQEQELCDNQDNNCNGQVDEGFSVGKDCHAGTGGCRTEGKHVCTSNGTSTRCNAVAKPPGKETCNGVDDDCDGKVDNQRGTANTLASPCFTGKSNGCKLQGNGTFVCTGACRSGQTTCNQGKWTACIGEITETPELCNDKKDNNCNGNTDEEPCQCQQGFTNCNSTCYDLKKDNNHCGSCNTKCSSQQSCSSGLCCDKGLTNCNGTCVNLSYNTTHCQSCGKSCAQGQDCVAGACQIRQLWVKTANGRIPGDSSFNHISSDSQGNLYVAGYFESELQLGSLALKRSGTGRGNFVAKRAPNGTWQWAVIIEGPNVPLMKTEQNGNTYLAGRLSQTIFLNNNLILTPTTKVGMYVAKLDTKGKWSWAKTVEPSGGRFKSIAPKSLSLNSTGQLYIVGNFRGSTAFGNLAPLKTSTEDLFVAKLDKNGTWSWSIASQTSPDGRSAGNVIALDKNQNIYIAGHMVGKTIRLGTFTFSINGPAKEGFVAKLSPQGSWQWIERITSSQSVEPEAITLDNTNNIYVTMRATGPITFGSSTFQSTPWQRVLIAKLSTGRKWQWAASITGQPISIMHTATNAKGETYVSSSFSGNVTFSGGSLQVKSSPTTNDWFLAKLTSTGQWTWAKQASSSNSMILSHDLIFAPSGDMLLVGELRGTVPFTDFQAKQPLRSKASTSDAMLLELDAQGLFKKVENFHSNTSGLDRVQALATEPQGNSYVAGVFSGTLVLGSITLSVPEQGLFVAKIDTQGKWLWAQQAAFSPKSNANAESKDIAFDSKGNVYLTGLFRTSLQLGSNLTLSGSSNREQLFVAKLDNKGAWSWSKTGTVTPLYKNIGSVNVPSIQVGSNDNIYIVGSFQGVLSMGSTSLTSSPMGTSQIFGSSQDLLVAKLDPSGTWKWIKHEHCKSKPCSGSIDGHAADLDRDDNLYIVGMTRYPVSIGTFASPSNTPSTMMVAKMDTQGVWKWAKYVPIFDPANRLDIATSQTGDSYITGWAKGTVDFKGAGKVQSSENSLFVSKIDNQGTWQWVQKPTLSGTTGSSMGQKITLTSTGNVFVVGSMSRASLSFRSTTLSTSSNQSFWATLSPQGTWQTAEAFPAISLSNIAKDESGNVFVAGGFSTSFTYNKLLYPFYGKDSDLFVLKFRP